MRFILPGQWTKQCAILVNYDFISVFDSHMVTQTSSSLKKLLNSFVDSRHLAQPAENIWVKYITLLFYPHFLLNHPLSPSHKITMKKDEEKTRQLQ